MADLALAIKIALDNTSMVRAVKGAMAAYGQLVRELQTKVGTIEAFEASQRKAVDFGAALTVAKEKLRSASQEMLASEGVTDRQKQNYRDLRAEVDRLSAALRREQQSVSSQSEALRAAGVDTARLAEEKRKLGAAALDAARAQQPEASRIRGRERLSGAREMLGVADSDGVQRQIDKMQAAYNRLAASGTLNLSQMGQAKQRLIEKTAELRSKLNGVVQAYSTIKEQSVAALASLGLAGAATAQASGRQVAVTNIDKVSSLTREQIAGIKQDLAELTTQIPLTFGQLAQIAVAAGQLNLPAQEYREFVRLVAESASAFEIPADEAGAAYGKIVNVFRLTLEQARLLGDGVNALADNIANVSERELLNVTTRAAGAAKQFGLTGQELAALGATFLSLGKPPEVAATAIEAMLLRLQSAEGRGPEFAAALATIGLSAEQLGDQIEAGPQQALDALLERLAGLSNRQRALVIGDLFGANFAGDIAGLVSGLDQYRSAVARVSDDSSYSGSVNRAFQKDLQTLAAQWALTKNELSNFAEAMTVGLLPVLTGGARVVQNLFAVLTQLASASPILSGLATQALVLATALLPLRLAGAGLINLFGRLAPLFVPLRAMFMGAGAAAAASSLSLAGVGSVLLRLVGGPIGLAIGALSVVAYWLDRIGDKAPVATQKIKRGFEEVAAQAQRAQAESAGTLPGLNDEQNAALKEAQAKKQQLEAGLTFAREKLRQGDDSKTVKDFEARIARVQKSITTLRSLSPSVPDFTPEPLAVAEPADVRSVDGQAARRRQLLDAEREDGNLSLQKYYAEREALEQRHYQALARIKSAEASREKDPAKKAVIESELTELRAARLQSSQMLARDLRLTEDRERKDALDAGLREEEAQTRLRFELNQRLLRANGDEHQAALDELRKLYVEWLAQAGDDAQAQELAKKVFSAESARLELDQIEREFDDLLSGIASRRAVVNARIQSGDLPANAGRRELQQLDDQERGTLRSRQQNLGAQLEQPGLARAQRESLTRELEQVTQQLAGLQTQGEKSFARLREGMEGGLTNAFEGLISGTQSAKQAFASLGDVVVKTLQRMAAEMLATALVEQSLSFLKGVFGFSGGGPVGSSSPAASSITSGGGLNAQSYGLAAAYGPGAATGGEIRDGALRLAKGGPGLRAMARQMGQRLDATRGGTVRGPGGPTSDSIRAWLSNGEFVIKADSVARYGTAMLEQINQGLLPVQREPALALATGGPVGDAFAGRSALGATAGMGVSIVIENKGPPVSAQESSRKQTGEGVQINLLMDQVEQAMAGRVRGGGPLATAMESTFGNRRQGRG